jgi:hypothetical protein
VAARRAACYHHANMAKFLRILTKIVTLVLAAIVLFYLVMLLIAALMSQPYIIYIAPIVFVACLLWGVWKIAAWYTRASASRKP